MVKRSFFSNNAFLCALGFSCFVLSGSVLAKGDFSSSCEFNLVGSKIKGVCLDNEMVLHRTELDLDGYITNSNGNLQWQEGGNYSVTSVKCKIFGATLSCYCNDTNNTLQWSTINLDDMIYNNNGNLEYQKTSSLPAKPESPKPEPSEQIEP